MGKMIIRQGLAEARQRIAYEVNRAVQRFQPGNYALLPYPYVKAINSRKLSLEEKKDRLMKALHTIAVKAFSIQPDKLTKTTLQPMREMIAVLRLIVQKLRNINHYLQLVFEHEYGPSGPARKGPQFSDQFSDKQKISDKQKRKHFTDNFTNKDLQLLEHLTYTLIERIISLDKRLLKGYEVKEEQLAMEERYTVKDLASLLGKESELLSHLEAKLPPAPALKLGFIKGTNLSHWVSRIFALLAAIEYYGKAQKGIFASLKKKRLAKLALNIKIAQLVKEKWQLLKARESRALAMAKAREITSQDARLFHHYLAANAL